MAGFHFVHCMYVHMNRHRLSCTHTPDLHTPVVGIGINERDPGGKLQCSKAGGIKVGIVLVPGHNSLLKLGRLGAEIPYRMT